MATFNLKRGDRLPKISATLKDSTGAVVDLSGGATVTFRMRKVGSTGALKVNTSANIVNAAGGVVEYPWAATDTDTAGDYEAEFVANFGSLVQTHPNDSYIDVKISEPLV
jgi:hypothetical protein